MIGILFVLTAAVILAPEKLPGPVADVVFLRICHERAPKEAKHWHGTFEVVDTHRESHFTVDHIGPEDGKVYKADRRSVEKLCQDVEQHEPIPEETTTCRVSWFAFLQEKSLWIYVNGAKMGRFERELLWQVRQNGDWGCVSAYFLGGPDDRDEPWILSDDVRFEEIFCGQNSLEVVFRQLQVLRVLRNVCVDQ